MNKEQVVQSFATVRELAMQMREATHTPGVLNPGLKCLISAALFTVIRCEPCYKAYLVLAHEFGATEEELLEVFNLVINAQGCVGDVWAARAVEFYKGLLSGKINPQDVLDELCDVLNPERITKLIDTLKS